MLQPKWPSFLHRDTRRSHSLQMTCVSFLDGDNSMISLQENRLALFLSRFVIECVLRDNDVGPNRKMTDVRDFRPTILSFCFPHGGVA